MALGLGAFSGVATSPPAPSACDGAAASRASYLACLTACSQRRTSCRQSPLLLASLRAQTSRFTLPRSALAWTPASPAAARRAFPMLRSCSMPYGSKSSAVHRPCARGTAVRCRRSTAFAMATRATAGAPGSRGMESRASRAAAAWAGCRETSWSASSTMTTTEGPRRLSCSAAAAMSFCPVRPAPEGPARCWKRPATERGWRWKQLTSRTRVSGCCSRNAPAAARVQQVLPVPGPPLTYSAPPRELGEARQACRKESSLRHSASRPTSG
mmetsp:Transcript_22347/g.66579  ORF Transcript_22347/g.66579 Transcript_22347/m.66579 type:complete len:270 (+) Transcript_22347:502-1311(+)